MSEKKNEKFKKVPVDFTQSMLKSMRYLASDTRKLLESIGHRDQRCEGIRRQLDVERQENIQQLKHHVQFRALGVKRKRRTASDELKTEELTSSSTADVPDHRNFESTKDMGVAPTLAQIEESGNFLSRLRAKNIRNAESICETLEKAVLNVDLVLLAYDHEVRGDQPTVTSEAVNLRKIPFRDIEERAKLIKGWDRNLGSHEARFPKLGAHSPSPLDSSRRLSKDGRRRFGRGGRRRVMLSERKGVNVEDMKLAEASPKGTKKIDKTSPSRGRGGRAVKGSNIRKGRVGNKPIKSKKKSLGNIKTGKSSNLEKTEKKKPQASKKAKSPSTAAKSTGKAAAKHDKFNVSNEVKVVKPTGPVYCYCRNVFHGQMVGCDNDNCKYGWFHYGCVGLTEDPPGDWYCPDCRLKPDIDNKPKTSV